MELRAGGVKAAHQAAVRSITRGVHHRAPTPPPPLSCACVRGIMLRRQPGATSGRHRGRLGCYRHKAKVLSGHNWDVRAPGTIAGALNAVKPGGSLWAVSGHAYLARLWANAGRVWGATAIKLGFIWSQLGRQQARNHRRASRGMFWYPCTPLYMGKGLTVHSV